MNGALKAGASGRKQRFPLFSRNCKIKMDSSAFFCRKCATSLTAKARSSNTSHRAWRLAPDAFRSRVPPAPGEREILQTAFSRKKMFGSRDLPRAHEVARSSFLMVTDDGQQVCFEKDNKHYNAEDRGSREKAASARAGAKQRAVETLFAKKLHQFGFTTRIEYRV